MTVNLEGIIPHMEILQLLPVLGNRRERSADGVDSLAIMHVEINVNAVLGCVGRFDEEEVVRFVVTVKCINRTVPVSCFLEALAVWIGWLAMMYVLWMLMIYH